MTSRNRDRAAIELPDLQEYLKKEESDFGFELKTLRLLRSRGLQCEHGGLYEDPVTEKSRQFDIRARMFYRPEFFFPQFVHLAVECKNVRPFSPVLVSCVPRTDSESYHSVAWLSEPPKAGPGSFALSVGDRSRAKVHLVHEPHSVYRQGEAVGKAYTQVSRRKDGGGFEDGDSRFFERLDQVLSSVAGLVRLMYYDGSDEKFEIALSTAVPIVVVPDGRLWVLNYDDDGKQIGEPGQVDRCSLYADKRFFMGDGLARAGFWISHVELLTTAGLDQFVSDLGTKAGMEKLFPVKAMVSSESD